MSTHVTRTPSKIVFARRWRLLAWGLLVGVLVFFVSLFWRRNEASQMALPPDFQLAAKVDLAARSYDGETVAEFSLEETAVVYIYYTLPNIDLTYFDLSLKGADDATHLILHSEDYQTDENGGGLWEKRLPKGSYQMVLTAPQSQGLLSIYWEYR